MDYNQIIQSFLVAANAYDVQCSEVNTTLLRREFEALKDITTRNENLRLFNLNQTTSMECVYALNKLLSNPNTSNELLVYAINVLSNLACDESIRQGLHRDYNVPDLLAKMVLLQPATQSCVLPALLLLEELEYGQKSQLNEEFLNFLMKNITSCSKLLCPCLGVLASMSRNNLPIQSFIKSQSQDELRLFSKALTKLLSHSDRSVSIYSLSIITSLFLHGSLCEKVFGSKNIGQTLGLIFNIMIVESFVSIRRYAADLMMDHLKVQFTQDAIVSYSSLEPMLRQLVACLESDHPSVYKILELLLAFCAVNKLRPLIGSILFDSPTLQDSSAYQSRASRSDIIDPFQSLVTWSRRNVDVYQSAPVLAVRLIRELYEDAIDNGQTSRGAPARSELVLPTMAHIILQDVCPSSAHLNERCRLTTAIVQLLNVMCLEPSLKLQVTSHVDEVACLKLAQFQIANNPVTYQTQSSAKNVEWREAGMELFLFVTNFLLTNLPETRRKENVKQLVQDTRIIPFLGRGLLSNQRSLVQETLSIITIGVTMEGFPVQVLADYLSMANRETRKESFHSSQLSSQISQPYSQQSPLQLRQEKENLEPQEKKLKVSGGDKDIDMIIERMNKSDISSSRVSDVIEIFQSKLQTFQTKENHLQDLIDAKTQALSQADRLNQHHRQRIQTLENEARRLTSALRNAEKEIESEKEKTSHYSSHAGNLTKETLRLQELVEEKEDALAERHKQIERLEQTVTKCQGEIDMLNEYNSLKQTHLDRLKQEMDGKDAKMAEMESHEKQLGKEIKMLKNSLEEMALTKEEMTKAKERLTRELGQLTDAYQEVKKKLADKEMEVENRKCDLDQKDQEIARLQDELDKHSEITAMIHNLSSRTAAANNKREKKGGRLAGRGETNS